jgi:hypothetical protein
VVIGFLLEDRVLLQLVPDSSLVGAQALAGLSGWQVFDGNVVTIGVLDNDWRALLGTTEM